MKTKQKRKSVRVNLTMKPDIYDIVNEYSKTVGIPITSVVLGIVKSVAPELQRISSVMAHAKNKVISEREVHQFGEIISSLTSRLDGFQKEHIGEGGKGPVSTESASGSAHPALAETEPGKGSLS